LAPSDGAVLGNPFGAEAGEFEWPIAAGGASVSVIGDQPLAIARSIHRLSSEVVISPEAETTATQNARRLTVVIALFVLVIAGGPTARAEDTQSIPVSAPIDTDSAGRGGDVAVSAVVRLLCLEHGTQGTGFLHKSGNVITADHVARDCSKLVMVLPDGARGALTILAMDQDHDLALLKPDVAVAAKALPIAQPSDFKVGTQVSTWGFPPGISACLRC
jgi:S1-C subfamily serine protease